MKKQAMTAVINRDRRLMALFGGLVVDAGLLIALVFVAVRLMA